MVAITRHRVLSHLTKFWRMPSARNGLIRVCWPDGVVKIQIIYAIPRKKEKKIFSFFHEKVGNVRGSFFFKVES